MATSEKHPGRKENIKYTDVVVIGNGPSGICLSFLLSGHWPYYTGAPHPDEYLEMRLKEAGLERSLIEQDLEFVSNGLEGRSSNPVALLFDALTHPDADMGIETPSLLRWKLSPDKEIPHVVLGRRAEGGAWQMMEGEMQTLSLGNWMQLPDLPVKEWLTRYRNAQGPSQTVPSNRASMEEVRKYYIDYVAKKGLVQYFSNHSTVTSVERVLDVSHSIDDESGEQKPCSRDHHGKFKWEVRGHRVKAVDYGVLETEDFCYRAPNVVLATGSYDMPNKLGVPGEHHPYIFHSQGELENAIKREQLTADSNPVVVVGAGLSAADAILFIRMHNIPILHIFRRDVEDPKIILKQLPEKLYPEYHMVHKMMQDGETDDGYRSYPQHQVVEFKDDRKVLVRRHGTGCDTMLQASFVMIRIGCKPDLSFMQGDGKDLGIVPGMPVDCKNNPMDVNPYTYQSVHEEGLFAMGPLVGDNFVRFLRGGALGITTQMWKKRDE